eukprot:TRINITY_DN17055_c0_g1_i1.p1 TRINITY_DN17055_c0_g1~~TRINITY_DN17055_c0_g1_i1.p1  ORF type:complete len:250 (-),score=40.37 TRINITY_DN17055_c0_g1_i1:21-770(-)
MDRQERVRRVARGVWRAPARRRRTVPQQGGGVRRRRPALRHRGRAQVRRLPGHWTGPLDPASLGALHGFFRLIASDEGRARQRHLRELVEEFNRRMRARPDIPVDTVCTAPIKSVHTGTMARSLRVVSALRDRGYFTCASSYPVMPRGMAAVRITFNASLSITEVDGLCDAIEVVCDELSATGDGVPQRDQRVHDAAFDAAEIAAAVAANTEATAMVTEAVMAVAAVGLTTETTTTSTLLKVEVGTVLA